MITVSEPLCTGCGVCIEICPTDAIRLEQGMAIIDQDECTQCEACLDACPEGAIFGVSEPAGQPARLPAHRPEPEVIRVRTDRVAPTVAPVTAPAVQRTGVLPALAGVVAYVGREWPRILPAVLDALERRPRTQGPGTTSTPDNRAASGRRGGGGRASGRQRRRRRRGE